MSLARSSPFCWTTTTLSFSTLKRHDDLNFGWQVPFTHTVGNGMQRARDALADLSFHDVRSLSECFQFVCIVKPQVPAHESLPTSPSPRISLTLSPETAFFGVLEKKCYQISQLNLMMNRSSSSCKVHVINCTKKFKPKVPS